MESNQWGQHLGRRTENACADETFLSCQFDLDLRQITSDEANGDTKIHFKKWLPDHLVPSGINHCISNDRYLTELDLYSIQPSTSFANNGQNWAPRKVCEK